MKLSKIAVGVDFSPESARAVDHALNLARRTGASLVLILVTTVPPPSSYKPNDALSALFREQLAADRNRLGELHDRLRGQGVEVSQGVFDGEPDEALADAASQVGAELIVVGTHGRTGIKRLALGSVAEKTVRLASCSVLVVRGDAPAGGYRDIVVGTDFSVQAAIAVDRAFEVAAPGGRVRVVHAWLAPYLEYDVGGRITASLLEAQELVAAEERAKLLARPRRDDVSPSLEVVTGAPFAVLDGFPDADLVVVGSHGRRGIRRLLLGSVAEATVRHARCSVLIAR